MLQLGTSVQYVKGIGPRLAEILAAKDIHTVGNLLNYLPFRYEDRLNPRTIAELRPGEMATVIAEVRTSGLFHTRTRRMPIFQMTAGQGRDRIKCLWFNATYLKDKFKAGQAVALYGKVEADQFRGEQFPFFLGGSIRPQESIERADARLVFAETHIGAVATK